jgi:uncharacterized protein
MIIDCHCHAGKGDGLTGPWNTSAPLADYFRWAARAGVTHTNVFSVFHSDSAEANRVVAGIVASNPARLSGFAVVHARNDAGRVRDVLQTAVASYGFRGIKVHRLESAISREVCDAARELSVPVLYDVAGQISQVELLAGEYPGVNFIIPHLGSFADDWKAQIALTDHLVRHPNIYADTSGVRRFDVLQRAVRRAGSHKFLFGSDGPWLHPGVELQKIKELRLPPVDEQLILWENFAKLTRMRERITRDSGQRTVLRGARPVLGGRCRSL